MLHNLLRTTCDMITKNLQKIKKISSVSKQRDMLCLLYGFQDILWIIIAKRQSNILYIWLRSSLLFIAVRMI